MSGTTKAARDGNALATYLEMEAIGSPYEAAQMGRPMNGPVADEDDAIRRADMEEVLARLVGYFEEAERAEQDSRRLAERDRDFYDGAQIDEATMAALKKRGQPPLVDNIIRDKVDLLAGMERKARTDPKAYPRTPNEEERANAATMALRYIADDCNMPSVRSAVYENILVEGYGGAELGLEDDGQGGATITITHVGWERIFVDPHSRARDFSDARYLGMVLWMDRDQLLELFTDAYDVIQDAFAFNGSSPAGSYNDRPDNVAWQDNQRTRVRVVQCYWLTGGTWYGATFTRAGFLAEPTPSAFKDRRGRSACPLMLQSAYIDRQNRRYGVVRDLISGQDAINKRQSKALHLLSVNQVIAQTGAVDDEKKAQREVAKPDGWVTVNGPAEQFRFEIQRGTDLAMGQLRLLELSYARMQAKGPNAAMSGTDPRDQSGRAILAQQAGGAAANEPLADALRQWTRRIFESAWMACREHWKGQKWLRVTDDMGATQWVGLNRPVTLGEDLAAMPEEQRAMMMQRMQIVPGDPRLGQVVRVENDIAGLDIDVSIEEGQDVPALQAEQFQALMQLAGARPDAIPTDVLIAASQLRDKDKILERLQQGQEAAGQSQQEQAAIGQKMAEADLRGKHAKAAADEALAVERTHGAAGKIAQVEKMASESPVMPVGEMGPPGWAQQGDMGA